MKNVPSKTQICLNLVESLTFYFEKKPSKNETLPITKHFFETY